MASFKTSRTWRPYVGNVNGVRIHVPAESHVDNATAYGPDDNYFFWSRVDWKQRFPPEGYPLLAHDLEHYGLLIPSNYCRPYRKEERQ